MSLKLAVFDLDGTIVDTSDMIVEAFRYGLEPWNIPIEPMDVERNRTRIHTDLFTEFLDNEDDKKIAYDRLLDYAIKATPNLPLFDGISELLEKLYQRDVKMAIWTGRDAESTKKLLKHKKIDHYFLEVIGNSCRPSNKPNPGGLQYILDQLNVSPEDTIMIGDHGHDIEGAQALGIKSVWASWSTEDLLGTELTPHFVANHPLEILNNYI